MKNTLIVAMLSMMLTVSSVWAGPTARLAGGSTEVALSSEFVGALGSLGVTPSRIAPGVLRLNKGTVSFPIPAGVIDAESLAGDIFHSGGLGLGVPGTQVSLLNFIISTTGEPVLTGVASVNGDVVDRIPLFDLDLSSATVTVKNNNKLSIASVGLTLNAIAAQTLNSVFGVDAFTEGFPIGVARVATKIRGVEDGND